MMKPQEIYNEISFNLFKQGKQSEGYHYHDKNGLKNSIGFIIPDDQYFEELDLYNKTFKWYTEQFKDRFPDWMKENLGLLESLLSAHDISFNWTSSENMKKYLTKIAERYKIKSDILKNLKFDWESNNEITVV